MSADSRIMHHDADVALKLKTLVSSEAYRYQRQRMLEMLAFSENPTDVLDVGCGEGSFCRDLRIKLSSGSKIIGVDISSFVLDLARKQEEDDGSKVAIEYELGDAEKLRFGVNCFDIVVCSSMLKYLQTIEREKSSLQEQLRVLKTGGQLLVVDSNDYSITYEGIDPVLERKIVHAYASLQGDPESGTRVGSLRSFQN